MRNALLGIFLCLFASAANADDNWEAAKAQLIADNPTVDLSEISYEDNTLNLRYYGVNDISALSGLTTLETLFLLDTPVSDISALSGLTALETLSLIGTEAVSYTHLTLPTTPYV